MRNALSGDQVAFYRENGYLCPVEAFDSREAATLRTRLETVERLPLAGSRPVSAYLRDNAHIVARVASDIALSRTVVDRVESILGPNILIWNCDVFIKEPGSSSIVAWHQDLTYWGMGETDEQVTAWVALSPATRQSGCMRFVPGSHKNAIVAHRETANADNVLSMKQEIAVDVDEAQAINAELLPGQMSFHHGKMFHASGPNTSADRRIGVAIRYVTPGVRSLSVPHDYAMLARGFDPDRNWFLFAPPVDDFDSASLGMHARVAQAQA